MASQRQLLKCKERLLIPMRELECHRGQEYQKTEVQSKHKRNSLSNHLIAHWQVDWYHSDMAKEFIPVNDLLERTSLEQFINHYSFDTQILRKGNEERIRNPFACEKCSGNNQAVSVNWKAAVFTSHCYHCSVRGRVTTLLFGMKYGRQPLGGKLRGR